MIKAIQVIQHRKTLKILAAVIVLTVLTAFLCFRFEGRIIKSYLIYFVEEKVSKSLGVNVTMESIKIGIMGPTVLKGFGVVKTVAGSDTPFIFKSDKLIIYNNVGQMIVDKLVKKVGLNGINLVFKIENGFLYKGKKPIFENINGSGKIVNSNLLFDDISGKCYDFPISVHGNVSGKTSKVEMDIESISSKLTGRLHVSNYVLRPHAVGTLELANGSKFYFSGDLTIAPDEYLAFENVMMQNAFVANGRVDFLKKKFSAEISRLKRVSNSPQQSQSKDIIQLAGDFSNPGLTQGSVLFNHVGIGRVDLQSQLDYEIASRDGGLSGKIATSGTILDYRPFKELAGEFSVEGKTLRITSLKLGDDYNLTGTVDLQSPYKMNLALDIKDSSLSQFLLVSDTESESKIGGSINGFIKTEGPLNNLSTSAKLGCSKGHIGNLDYESMNINLRGNGSVLKVADSRIQRKEGYIVLSGEVDLRRLWSTEPYKGLAWTCGNEAIVWNGWNIMKETNSKEVEMKKGVGNDKEFMVTFKGYLNDEQSWQDTQGHKHDEAIGVEYKLDDAKQVKMQLKSNEEVFSLEHKAKF
jgi:hypothetical protein